MNSQGPATVHYEVYALSGQRWTLHARFQRNEKEDALEEAKSIENGLGQCAKVIKETYYPGNNTSEEILVYSSDKNFRPRAQAQAYRPRAFARGEAGTSVNFHVPDFRPTAAKSAPANGSMGILLKLLLVVGASLAIACGVAAIVSNFLGKLPAYGAPVSDDSVARLLFLTFVLSFLVSAVPLALKFLGWRNDGVKRKFSAKAPPPPPAVKETKAAEPPQPIAPSPPETTPAMAPFGESVPETPVPETPPEGEKPNATMVAAEQSAASEETSKEPQKEPQETESLDSLRIMMIRFLSALLGEVKKVQPTLDAYSIFGVDLMLAGAIEAMGTHKHLDAQDKRSILKETIEVMGTKAETAQAFADKYEDYLVEPKYLAMVQVGRNAMEATLAGADADFSQEGLPQALGGWNKPQQTAQASARIITVLFTDMVGSTDLTQARGDQAAQDIVRRHNSIVRTALADFAGREIKHTGDGIMASFASTSNGVEAAINIQRACAAHNARRPDLPLHLRIGLNAGEPIEEEDDLFGTTVQLSARVCAESATDEILCTNVVRELSAGRAIVFTAKGVHPLKGFKDAVPLYAVQWASPAPVEKKKAAPRTATKSPKTKPAKPAAAVPVEDGEHVAPPVAPTPPQP